MSLAKLTCTLITAFALDKSFTPPSVSSKDERVVFKTMTWDIRAVNVLMRAVVYMRATYWAVHIAEIVVIIGDMAPSSWISKDIIIPLLTRGETGNVHLTAFSATGMLLIVLGAFIRVQCYRTLKDSFTFEHSIRKEHKLETAGPYSVVRHPAYTALLFSYIGMFPWFGSPGSWLRESGVLDKTAGVMFFGAVQGVAVALYIVVLMRMKREDMVLRETFKEEWDRWAERVPYSFIPYVY